MADILNKFINIFGQFILVPIFLTYWGTQVYGEWLALYAVVGYLSLVDFGLQSFVLNRLNQCYTEKNLHQYLRIFHSAFWGSILVSIMAIVFAGSILDYLPIENWLSFEITNHEKAVQIATFLMLQILLAIPLGLITGIYRTIKENPRGVMVANVQRGFYFLLTAGVVFSGAGPVEVALVQLTPLIGVAFYVIWDLKRRHPAIQIGIKNKDVKLALSFIGPSLYFFLLTLSLIISVQGSTLLVSTILGSSIVATFVTLRTLANLIKQLTVPLNHALWPEITIWETQGRYETLGAIHQMMTKFLLTFGICSAIFIHFLGPEILAFWTQGKIDFNPKLMDAFLLLVVTQMFWFPSSIILGATNNHKSLGKSSIASAFLGLIFAYFLIEPYGLPGVIYGQWIADLTICGWFIPRSTCILTNKNYWYFIWETLFKGMLLFLLVYLGINYLFTHLHFNSILSKLIFFGILISSSGVLVGYFFYLKKDEKNKFQSIFQKLSSSIPTNAFKFLS